MVTCTGQLFSSFPKITDKQELPEPCPPLNYTGGNVYGVMNMFIILTVVMVLQVICRLKLIIWFILNMWFIAYQFYFNKAV